METATRRTYNTNGSYTLILPKLWMKKLGVKFGDKVALILRDNDMLVINRMGEKEDGHRETG